MFGFNKKKEQEQSAQVNPINQERTQAFAPGTKITYKQELITKFKQDHAILLTLFEKALKAYESKESEKLVALLIKMKDALRAHLLDEELNFYIYLRHCYSSDKDNLEIITNYKKEMKEIGMEVFAFLKKHTSDGAAILQDDTFLSQYLDIGKILTKRIDAEETFLYPLYKMP